MADPVNLFASGEGLDVAKPVDAVNLFAPDPNAPGPFARGVKSGLAGVKSSLYGAGALAARGATNILPAAVAPITQGLEATALANAEEQSRLASEQSMRYEDVVADPSRAGEFIKWGLGSAIPSLALMFAGGVVGRGLGALAGRSLAPAAAATAKNVGMFTGAVVPDVAVEAGSIFPEAIKEGVENPGMRSLVGGAAAGAVDFLALPPALRTLMAPAAIARKAGFGAAAKMTALEAVKRAPVVGGLEAAQEASQAVIEMLAAGQDISSPAGISNIINSALVGGIAGGALGGAAGGFHGATASVQESPVFTKREQPPIVNTPVSAPAEIPPLSSEVPIPGTENVGTSQQVPTDPVALHAAAAEEVAGVEAVLAQVQVAHDTAVVTSEALAAEYEASKTTPPGERRAKNVILAEKKAAQKAVATAKAELEKVGGALFSVRQKATEIAAQLDPAAAAMAAQGVDIKPVPAAATAVPTIEEQTARAVEGARIAAGGNVSYTAPNGPESIIDDALGGKSGNASYIGQTQAERVTNATLPDIKELVLAKLTGQGESLIAGISSKVERAVTAALALPTIPERVAAIRATVPKAFAGKLNKVDAADFADGIARKVGNRTLWSRGASELPSTGTVQRVQTDGGVKNGRTTEGSVVESGNVVRQGSMEQTVGDVAGTGVGVAPINSRSRDEKGAAEFQHLTDTQVREKYLALSNAVERATDPAQSGAIRQQAGNLRRQLWKADKEMLRRKIPYSQSRAALTQEGFKSRGASERGANYDRAWKEYSGLPGVDADYMARTKISDLVFGAQTEVDLSNEGEVEHTPKQVARIQAFISKWSGVQDSHAALTQDEFDVLPEPAKFAAVDEFNRVMREKGTALRQEIARMLGPRPGLIMKTFMATPDSPIGSYTRVDTLKSVITMALNALDGLSVAAHEGYHAAEDLVLTKSEIQIITNALKADRPMMLQLQGKLQQYDRENNTHLADEVSAIPAEARAYAYEFWKRGELQVEGRLATIFKQLQQFFERVANLVRGLGFKSMEDIFTALDRGQFAERESNSGQESGGAVNSRGEQSSWYKSALTDAVRALPTKAASVQGWKDQIKGLVGKNDVKQVEIDAVGLNEFLDLQQGKVTRDQVMAFLGENGVRVEETVLGDTGTWTNADSERLDLLEQRNWEHIPTTEAEDAERQALITRENLAGGKNNVLLTKFGPDSHPTMSLPGGINYRELLLRLPERRLRPEEAEVDDKVVARYIGIGQQAWDRLTHDAQNAYRMDWYETHPSYKGTFKSSHFDQPNILAHIRFNERTDAEGKRVLFLEEIQSDWAQKGKKEGFASDKPPADLNVFQAGTGRWIGNWNGIGRSVGPFNTREEVIRAATQKQGSGIPSAPFVAKREFAVFKDGQELKRKDKNGKEFTERYDTQEKAQAAAARLGGEARDMGIGEDTEAWVALSLKRMIRYAAENGFDKVAWTTGEQQAERYDLSKQVDKIEWSPLFPTNKQHVEIRMIDGLIVKLQVEEHEVVWSDRAHDTVGKDLSDVVGKEVAEKIIASHRGVLQGEGLKIGGEGMKAFYDKIVPNVANDVLKKLGGGRVENIKVKNGQERMPEIGDYISTAAWAEAVRNAKPGDLILTQPGFTITPALVEAAAGGIPLFSRATVTALVPTNLQALYSKAAVIAEQQIRTQTEEGELERMQTQASFLNIHENAQIPGPSFEFVTGLAKAEANGFKRWWFKNIATPNFVSKSSLGYKNVMNTLNTYIRYRKILAEQMLREKLPSWYKAPDADRRAAFGAMLKRTVEGYSKDSTELTALLAALTPEQKTLYTQATGMIEGFLRAQFVKDQAARKTQLTSPGAYEKWEADRKAQVDSMIDKGYVPLRRYGDYSVRVYAETPDGKRIDGGLVFVDTERGALTVAKMYQDEIDRAGANLKVEQGTRDKNARDTGISIEQFLGTLRRNGVDISQAERERLVLTFTNSESMIRNKLMHREGLPGYSEDSMRVLHEFGVNTSGELAYARFATAIDAASEGREVTADVNSVNSEPEIKVDERAPNEDGTGYEPVEDFKARNLWTRDGQYSGFYKGIANELSNYVLVPDHSGGWSRRLRAGAMVYFIGGSLSGAVVNAMSIPMLTVPELSIHTGYGNALTTTLGAWKDAWRYYHILRDTEKLTDPSVEIPGISMELRQALRAASDHIFDTEIHQMLGMSQGTVYSKSRKVQRAMEVWMSPFRVSEQTNRLASFMAAYKIGTENKLTGQELFKFASGIVDSTQNNYNESNRPGAARNPIFALMFMFKSFPLFMIEAIALMYKQSPKSAVYMLLGLTMMTGVQGLPFAETIEDLIDTIAQQIFGSPFNSRRAMRNVIKSASEAMVGADLSEVVLRGVINDMLGVSVSSRIGAGDFVPGSRLGTADADKGRVLSDMLGAPFAMVKDALANVGGAVGGLATADWKQVADALRAGGPVAIRNAIKGAEQLNTGFAWDSKGRKVADVNTLSAVLQLGGLSSAKVAKLYEFESINIQTKSFHTQFGQDLQNQLVKALAANDAAKVQEINDLRVAWNKEYPSMPIMANAAATRRAIILAGVPLDRRSIMLMSRSMRGSNIFSENAEQ